MQYFNTSRLSSEMLTKIVSSN